MSLEYHFGDHFPVFLLKMSLEYHFDDHFPVSLEFQWYFSTLTEIPVEYNWNSSVKDIPVE